MSFRSDLTKLPAFDRETSCWHAVIETPQGSHHKYTFAPKLGCFELIAKVRVARSNRVARAS